MASATRADTGSWLALASRVQRDVLGVRHAEVQRMHGHGTAARAARHLAVPLVGAVNPDAPLPCRGQPLRHLVPDRTRESYRTLAFDTGHFVELGATPRLVPAIGAEVGQHFDHLGLCHIFAAGPRRNGAELFDAAVALRPPARARPIGNVVLHAVRLPQRGLTRAVVRVVVAFDVLAPRAHAVAILIQHPLHHLSAARATSSSLPQAFRCVCNSAQMDGASA